MAEKFVPKSATEMRKDSSSGAGEALKKSREKKQAREQMAEAKEVKIDFSAEPGAIEVALTSGDLNIADLDMTHILPKSDGETMSFEPDMDKVKDLTIAISRAGINGSEIPGELAEFFEEAITDLLADKKYADSSDSLKATLDQIQNPQEAKPAQVNVEMDEGADAREMLKKSAEQRDAKIEARSKEMAATMGAKKEAEAQAAPETKTEGPAEDNLEDNDILLRAKDLGFSHLAEMASMDIADAKDDITSAREELSTKYGLSDSQLDNAEQGTLKVGALGRLKGLFFGKAARKNALIEQLADRRYTLDQFDLLKEAVRTENAPDAQKKPETMGSRARQGMEDRQAKLERSSRNVA